MANDYKVDSIKVLSDIEHIRTRPGMYIGELDVPPLALFNEAIDNAFDEAQNDPKSETIVRITEENGLFKYSVRDHGRGIPIGEIDLPDGRKMEALEALITTTNSGAKFNSGVYRISCGLHGVGCACICALSKYMHMVTYRDGEAVEFISENGIKKALNHYPEINEVNGVLTEFIADPELWNTTEIPIDSIIDRCKVANAMGYKIKLYYNNEEIKIDTKSILDLLPIENVSDYCSDTIRIDNKETGEYFLVGFKYTSDTKSKSYGYTDLLPNRYGGTHIKIITDNLCRAWREFYNDDSVWWNDSLLGVRLVVAAFISNVSFSSQTKEKLTVPYKQLNFFGEEFLKEFKKWMKKNRNLSDKLFARFKEYRQSLIKLQNQKDIAGKVKIATIDKEGKTRRSQIVDKLMDCTSNKVEDTELFIVEGDSAAGVVARPRDRKTQAVLPLRGKIQNVSGMSYKDALKHETVANIINSLGAGIGESADPKKCRYERIIISTDADDDGCFEGSVKVKSLDGKSYSFKELVDNNVKELWVYSKDRNGNTVPALATNPRITKYVDKLIELQFINGSTIRCTPDHKILLKSGEYKEAQNLDNTDEISSLYFKRNNKGYLQFYDDTKESYTNVHTFVNCFFNNDIKLELLDNVPDNYSNRDKVIVTHHIDCNKNNNIPDNLKFMYWKDHSNYHSKLGHVTGKITGKRNITKYNKSPERIIKLKEKWKNESYKNRMLQGLRDYNKSDENSISTIKMNKNDDIKILQIKGKILSIVSYMYQNGIDFNEENYDKTLKRLSGNTCSYCNILNYFSSIEELLDEARNHKPHSGRLHESYNKMKKNRNRIAKLINNVLSSGNILNEESYSKERTSRSDPKWSSIINYFDSIEDALEYSKIYNHRIISKKFVELDEKIPVYDLTVDNYHNFLIETSDDSMEGIFVHNCHIVALVLTALVNLVPPIVRAGMVYLLDPPLYKYYVDGKPVYTSDFDSVPENAKGFIRFKGLGAMEDEDFKNTCLNKNNRTLYQITYPDDIDQFNYIAGTSAGRSELLKRYGVIKDISAELEESEE